MFSLAQVVRASRSSSNRYAACAFRLPDVRSQALQLWARSFSLGWRRQERSCVFSSQNWGANDKAPVLCSCVVITSQASAQLPAQTLCDGFQHKL